MHRKKRNERTPHPDPAVELQLQLIASLMRRMRLAEQQITIYQRELEDAHDDNSRLIAKVAGYRNAKAILNEIRGFLRHRIEAAEQGAREQHELAASLREQVQAEAEKLQLSDSDMAYLDLGEI